MNRHVKHFIGLMSGTSADGIDGVVLDVHPDGRFQVARSISEPYPDTVRQRINALVTDPATHLDLVGHLDTELGELFAVVANKLVAGSDEGSIAAIGSHGQTVRHVPEGEHPFTLQLGNGPLIAQRTGLPVVSDFRRADMARGGQGAPLAPAFHRVAFSSEDTCRVILNLGGIANVTHLPGQGDVTGFDTGPANTLLDAWCARHFDRPFDRNGELSATGSPAQGLLQALLDEPFFARRPPKSTGRELFNLAWVDRAITVAKAGDLPAEDVLATLTQLTARSIAEQVNRLSPRPRSIYGCGGGVHNASLMECLETHCDAPVSTTAALGIEPRWVEAAAFAWMAGQALQRQPWTPPSVTGADRATVGGSIHYPD